MSSTSASSSALKSVVKPPVVQPGSGNAIIINPCQRLNPILESIRNVNKEFGDIVPDFQLGRTTCALFLSLKYHRLHPEYIHGRIQKLGNMFNLRILLLMCDITQHQDPIRELTKVCLINNITVIVAWSPEEAGMYLSTYKAFEFKAPTIIKERVDKDYSSMLRSSLTSINRVNKMDVETLRTSFGSFANVAKANAEQLRDLPGFGPVKVRRVMDAFNKPFRNNATSSLKNSQRRPAPSQNQFTSLSQLASRALEEAGSSRDSTQATQASGSMPPPPIPHKNASREESPPWDIDLDLNDEELFNFSSSNNLLSDKPTSMSGTAKGKEKADVLATASPSVEAQSVSNAPPRESSPPWDIELDLNDDDFQDSLPTPKTKPVSPAVSISSPSSSNGEDVEPPPSTQPRKRSPSPTWDIELDLNESD